MGAGAYQGFVSPDRVVSSYVAGLDGAAWSRTRSISCSNWPAVRDGKVKALAGLPEYTFFRIRYPRGDGLPSPSGRRAGGEGDGIPSSSGKGQGGGRRSPLALWGQG